MTEIPGAGIFKNLMQAQQTMLDTKHKITAEYKATSRKQLQRFKRLQYGVGRELKIIEIKLKKVERHIYRKVDESDYDSVGIFGVNHIRLEAYRYSLDFMRDLIHDLKRTLEQDKDHRAELAQQDAHMGSKIGSELE